MLAATYRVIIERHEVDGIPALTFRNEGTEATGKGPFVFALHGLTSRKERHLDLCLRLADAGCRVCAFDIFGHGERREAEAELLFGPRTAPGFAEVFIATVLGTIRELKGLADYFDLTRYAVVGHSMGGYIAMRTTLDDPRIAAVVNIAGSIDTTRFPVPENAPPAIRALAAEADIRARAAEFAPRSVLLLHGDHDETVPFSGAEGLYGALKAAYGSMDDRVKLIAYPGLTHRDFPSAMAQDAVDWLVRNINS